MSFSVKFSPTKEEIFENSDEECRKLAETLRSTGGVFVDPEFPPNAASLGTIGDRKYFEKPDAPWHAPHQFDKNWSVYNDPWPFEIAQRTLGDCWLIAALMCIARRKEILEHVLPPRDYNVDCGIVQVRLFIDGQWQVIKIDYHIPQIDGKERFVRSNSMHFWAAFIEKAFAKVKGSYGKLDGGDADWALKCLTGYPCRLIQFTTWYFSGYMWKDLTESNSCGYLMVAGINKLEDDSDRKDDYENSVFKPEHAYSILDVKEHDGNQLILIGDTQPVDYKHEFLPVYNKEISCKFHAADKDIESRLFWIKLEDFMHFFNRFYACEYRGIFHKKCFSQTIKRTVKQDCQVLRLDTKHLQSFRIEVISKDWKVPDGTYMYLNIHRANSNNKCGELLKTVEYRRAGIDFLIESITFDPGSYFLVFISTENSDNEYTLDWTIESSTTLENVSISFANFPCTLLVESLQTMIMKYGERKEIENEVEYEYNEDEDWEEDEKEKIIAYIWLGGRSSLALVENTSNSDYIRVRTFLPWSDTKVTALDYRWQGYRMNAWWKVPPNTRSIVALESSKFCGLTIEEFTVNFWSQLPSDWLEFAISEWHRPYFFTPLLIEPNTDS